MGMIIITPAFIMAAIGAIGLIVCLALLPLTVKNRPELFEPNPCRDSPLDIVYLYGGDAALTKLTEIGIDVSGYNSQEIKR